MFSHYLSFADDVIPVCLDVPPCRKDKRRISEKFERCVLLFVVASNPRDPGTFERSKLLLGVIGKLRQFGEMLCFT